MKKAVIIFVILLISRIATAQLGTFGVIVGGGGTIVDVANVVDPYVLSDWNTWGMVVKGFAEYKIGEGIGLGLEIGSNRLYYWEYKAPGYSWYYWRNEWTTNAVIYLSKTLGKNGYLQAGPGFHKFHHGTAFGLMLGGGRYFTVSEKFSIPVFLRVEPIFGVSTPIAINIGTGLRYNLLK